VVSFFFGGGGINPLISRGHAPVRSMLFVQSVSALTWCLARRIQYITMKRKAIRLTKYVGVRNWPVK